jgi:LysR family transcriptional activator of nhaA
MEWLNYHHLHYFWMVAREGSLAAAAAKLRLSPPTLSAQINSLERALGEDLFVKQGRRMVLTDTGTVAYRYAEEIFAIGRELVGTIQGGTSGRPTRFAVGVTQSVPKLIARRILEPVQKLSEPMRLICREEPTERLLADLAVHTLDVVLTDAPQVKRRWPFTALKLLQLNSARAFPVRSRARRFSFRPRAAQLAGHWRPTLIRLA